MRNCKAAHLHAVTRPVIPPLNAPSRIRCKRGTPGANNPKNPNALKRSGWRKKIPAASPKTVDEIDFWDLDMFVSGDPHAAWRILRQDAPVWWHDRPGGEPQHHQRQ